MKLLYVANVRIPTEKAHGVAIVKACEAFGRAGVETELVVPKRRTPFTKDVFETYGVERNFSIKFLPTIDRISSTSGPFIFWLQTATFQLSVFFYFLLESRKSIIYTRDPNFIGLRALGFQVIFECHLIPKRRAAFFRIVKNASKIVVISKALKNAFLEEGFSPEEILVAPSGVDLSIFDIAVKKEDARKELDLPRDAYIATYTGNFTTMGEDKGISDIIKALPKAAGVTFVAVGGSEKDIARYAAEAKDLGVADRVVLRGSTTQKNLALYQKAADVLLMPFPDTLHYRKHMSPVKMFEYMVAKRPIIASDLPTIREVLNNKNAILIPPGDPQAISGALRGAFTKSYAMDGLAKHAHRDVGYYSWEVRTKKILSYISSV